MLDNEVSARQPLAEVGAEGGPAPVQRRKRGKELRAAVHAAVLDELREGGIAALTMDAVAARARTGKATLYRHWPGKIELVLDAFQCSMPRIEIPDDDGDLRGQLLAVLRQIAGAIDSPNGDAVLGMIAELIRAPELADSLRPHIDVPYTDSVMEVLRRAAVRGQIPAAALTPRVAMVGHDLLLTQAIINGTAVPDAAVIEIVDLVLLPLLRGYSVPSA
jgi:AcrR family transcriptional regulator